MGLHKKKELGVSERFPKILRNDLKNRLSRKRSNSIAVESNRIPTLVRAKSNSSGNVYHNEFSKTMTEKLYNLAKAIKF